MRFEVEHKIQEQCGSWFVFLPLWWVKAMKLKESDLMKLTIEDEKITITKVE